MSFLSLSSALYVLPDSEPPLAGLEAKIFRELLMVLASGELRPGASLSEEGLADIYGIAPDRIGHVFRAMEHVGLLSSSSSAGAQIETIAPGDAPQVIKRARTLTRYIVEGLAASGLDRAGREALSRHIRHQAAAEAGGDWPRTNILCMEFLALLGRAGRRSGGLPRFDRQAMRLMLLRASYDRFGEPAPSASTQSLLLGLIVERRADEAVRVVEALYDGIDQRLWLEDGGPRADLRGLMARRGDADARSARSALRLIAVGGRRLDA